MARNLLSGQTAIITGAGQGLGRAIALEYAAEGATVALLERNADSLAEVESALKDAGCPALAFQVDVTDYAAVGQAVESIIKQTGRIDVLVNNAGIFRNGTILEDTLEDWRAVLTVNLEAVYMVSKLVAPHMVERRSGRIVHIASVAGFASRGSVGSYNASKGGVIALTKSMAIELAPHGIAVNAIAPGFMRTAMMRSDDGSDQTADENFTTLYINKRRIPMARAAEPEDVAGTAVFLASDYCRYMTGQVLVVDGGLTSTF
ncbi:MAG: SDR family oxidoreductase [Anaerolineae bacterium]|nr:SDR family oxidoreductase [Anaerolineae bacterium]